jgi:hypothetical protein
LTPKLEISNEKRTEEYTVHIEEDYSKIMTEIKELRLKVKAYEEDQMKTDKKRVRPEEESPVFFDHMEEDCNSVFLLDPPNDSSSWDFI